MLAYLRADIINSGMRGPKEPISASDLMPRDEQHLESDKPFRMTARRRKLVAERARARMAAMGNLVVVNARGEPVT